MNHIEDNRLATRDVVEAIYRLPPRYPQVGHQYVCGYNDGKYDAGELVQRHGLIATEAVRKAQDILAEYIVPDSGITDVECVNRLLGVLDDQRLVAAMHHPAAGG